MNKVLQASDMGKAPKWNATARWLAKILTEGRESVPFWNYSLPSNYLHNYINISNNFS